jgi:mannose/fructose-specific phosphotransferase system component IIA
MILIITHCTLGDSLIRICRSLFEVDDLSLRYSLFQVTYKESTNALLAHFKEWLASLPKDGSFLIFTDIPGATPHNLAVEHFSHLDCRIISGVNLPMLIKVFSHPGSNLDSLASLALEGGHEGILKTVVPCGIEHD